MKSKGPFSGLAIVGFLVGAVAIILLWNTRLRPLVVGIVLLILLGWILRFGPTVTSQMHQAAQVIGGKKA